ncbi:MAG: glycosyltransferase family 4 protein [Bacteroidales bacterium]|nr:glycosyltransferase family 4 protein [Bacteroidales bacterium]
MKDKVVFINQSTGYLMIDIVNAFASQCKETALIAGSIKENERSLNPSTKVDKIVEYNRTSIFKRLLTWVWGTIQIYFKLLFKYRGWYVVYVTNPPLSYLLSLCLKNPFSIIVYDIYPDALTNIGIKKTNFLYKKWEKWNNKLFAKADRIFTLSDGMKKQLSLYTNNDKIVSIPNWSASNDLKPINKESNIFIQNNNLTDKFIVLYSGNIGNTHNVEYIIEVAKKLKDNKDIQFLIIGEGGKKRMLENKVVEYGLNNCSFLTWQSVDMMPYSLASADIAVVTLNDDTAALSVPSKTYNLLAVGAPLLCIASEKTELYKLVSEYNNGKCFDKNAIEEMSKYILDMYNNPNLKNKLSNNSLEASKQFTYKNAEQYVQELL